MFCFSRRLVHTAAMLAMASLASALGAQTQRPSELRIGPPVRAFAAGDSLRLTVQVLDARGNVVPDVPVRFSALGGRMQGTVDSLGWVHGGAPGTIPVSVIATPAGGRPLTERVEVRVDPGPAARVVLAPRASKLLVGQRLRLEATVLSAAGDAREDRVTWSSSNERVLRVVDGVVTALGVGTATVRGQAGGVTGELPLQVVASTGVSARLAPERVQARQGDVIRFALTVTDARGARVDGIRPTWSISPGHGAIDEDGAFVGYLPGTYVVMANLGERSADAVVTLAPRDVRRPITVVGRLPRTAFFSSELWLHPDGKHAYLGTTGGGDRIYAIDISDPANPVITDSIVANSRSMNDLMTTEDGRWLVFTREGAADRRNGIVIASVEDPAHPKPVAEFTDGVTAGVHSAFVYTQPTYGTHVYLTNNGTGALNIIDLNDPHNPKRVSEWRSKAPSAGRRLHDVDVKDGLAYVSYWSDGLVILDVGNGIKGGSPSNPKLVSNLRYRAEELYPDATTRYGPGFISGTHTAWRHKDYVFIADEVFPPYSPTEYWDIANIRAYGRLQVIDVSDIERPKSVAWFEPEYGGVHNVWAAGDTLYVAAYNGGFHAFDVSGELRGDLKAQGRTIADLRPADEHGVVPNKAFTWGVIAKDGLVYLNDMITGLWIVRMESQPIVP